MEFHQFLYKRFEIRIENEGYGNSTLVLLQLDTPSNIPNQLSKFTELLKPGETLAFRTQQVEQGSCSGSITTKNIQSMHLCRALEPNTTFEKINEALAEMVDTVEAINKLVMKFRDRPSW